MGEWMGVSGVRESGGAYFARLQAMWSFCCLPTKGVQQGGKDISGVVEGNARRGVRMSAGVCKSRVSQGLAGVEDRGSQEDVTLKKIEAAGAKGEILCAIMLSVGMK